MKVKRRQVTVLIRHSFCLSKRYRGGNVLVKMVLLCDAKRTQIWNYICLFSTRPNASRKIRFFIKAHTSRASIVICILRFSCVWFILYSGFNLTTVVYIIWERERERVSLQCTWTSMYSRLGKAFKHCLYSHPINIIHYETFPITSVWLIKKTYRSLRSKSEINIQLLWMLYLQKGVSVILLLSHASLLYTRSY